MALDSPPAAGPSDLIRPLRVLVVEDDRDIAHLLHTLFAARGYQTEVVHDGGDAVAAFEALAPDLVTLDVGVPTIDGEELCQRFRAVSDAYILMLSARTDTALIERCLSLGADAYLSKPFSTRELHTHIAEITTRRRRSA